MSRDRIVKIRGSLELKINSVSSNSQSGVDPLHSCRRLLDTISTTFANTCVPTRTAALDEATCRSKARNRAISYIPSKPDKFGVRFYCVVGTSGPYIHSIFDNGRGWNTGINQVDRYNHLHGEFAQILNREFGPESTVARNSASALCVCQLVHQSRLYREPNHYRVIFCDNFYTSPRLAEKLFSVSQGDLKMIGTCKVPNIDGINRPIIVDCLKLLKNVERGSWLLARTYSYDKQYDNQRNRSDDPNVKSYRVIPDKYIQPNSGLIF